MRKILMNFSILGVFWYFGILSVFCILNLKISKIGSHPLGLGADHDARRQAMAEAQAAARMDLVTSLC